MDLGAGSTYNIIDFFLTTYTGLIVVSPDFTSILNAYSFLKSAVFRFCYRQFPAKSPERQILQNSVLQRMEGKDYSFLSILNVIKDNFPESGTKAIEELSKLKPKIIMNMGRSPNDLELGNRLLHLTKNKLNIDAEYIGFVPYDENVQYSIARRQPLVLSTPSCAFCSAIPSIVKKIENFSAESATDLEDAQESLEDIIRTFYENKKTQENL